MIHTTPAAFGEGVFGFAGVPEAGVVEAELVEGEAVAVEGGFAEVGELELAAVDCGLSELPDCGDCAIRSAWLTTNTTSVDAMSRARYRFFALRFIIWLLTEMRVHRNACPLECTRARFSA